MRGFVFAALLSGANGAECTKLCLGFRPDDCSCTDAGAWAMWTCTSKGGVRQSKPFFCSQPTCGCNGGDELSDEEAVTAAPAVPTTAARTTEMPSVPVKVPVEHLQGTGAPPAQPDARQLLFWNSCKQSVVVKYSQGGKIFNQHLATLSPSGGHHSFDIEGQQDKGAWVFTPYFAVIKPEDRNICPADGCRGWGISRPPQGHDWIDPANHQHAAVCNPSLSGPTQPDWMLGCCNQSTPNYDAATGDCPGINDMTWGTEVEFTFDGSADLDSFDISTNFKDPVGGNVYFNIPVALSAMASGSLLHTCNNAQGIVQWPVKCLHADCTTAYQDPRDKADNGAQLQCPAGVGSSTSYVVEFCPDGVSSLQGLSDASVPLQEYSSLSGSGSSIPWLVLSLLVSTFVIRLMQQRSSWRPQLHEQKPLQADEEVAPVE